MSAWKPLQMPSIRPSRCFSRSVTASGHRGVAEEGGDELARSRPARRRRRSRRGRMMIWASSQLPWPSGFTAVGNVRRRSGCSDTRICGSPPACAEGAGGVILAVGAGEDGDKHPRASRRTARGRTRLLVGRSCSSAGIRRAGAVRLGDRPAPAWLPTSVPAARPGRACLRRRSQRVAPRW